MLHEAHDHPDSRQCGCDSSETEIFAGRWHSAPRSLGVSEQSDSVTFIVSEETGNISVACDGKLRIHLDTIAIRLILEELFMKKNGGSKPWTRILRRQKHE